MSLLLVLFHNYTSLFTCTYLFATVRISFYIHTSLLLVSFDMYTSLLLVSFHIYESLPTCTRLFGWFLFACTHLLMTHVASHKTRWVSLLVLTSFLTHTKFSSLRIWRSWLNRSLVQVFARKYVCFDTLNSHHMDSDVRDSVLSRSLL